MSKEWPDEHVQMLRRLVLLEGKTDGQIVSDFKKLGIVVTRNAVIGKRTRLGLTIPEHLRSERASVASTRNNAIRKPRLKSPASLPSSAPKSRAPTRAEREETKGRFTDRRFGRTCAMFLKDESGPDGFVCGRPVAIGSNGQWCSSCRAIVFQQQHQPMERAA